jgi:hypothetical protein
MQSGYFSEFLVLPHIFNNIDSDPCSVDANLTMHIPVLTGARTDWRALTGFISRFLHESMTRCRLVLNEAALAFDPPHPSFVIALLF